MGDPNASESDVRLPEHQPGDVPLTDAERAVRDEQTHDSERDHDATAEAEHKRPPWAETGEHPNHPEVAGEPDPAG